MVEELAFTLDLIGKILVGIAIVRVHVHLGREKKVDKLILKDIKRERWWTYAGFLFLIAGWILHVFY